MESLEDIRIAKVEHIANVYGNASIRPSHRSTMVANLLDEENFVALTESNSEVEVHGRIYSKRGKGKIIFLDVYDQSGKIQVFLEVATLGEETFENLKSTLDMGDIVEVRGTMFRTPAGEITVKATHFAILTKCVLPPTIGKTKDGEHLFALADTEQRYRQRYLHLMSVPEDRELFIDRSKIVAFVRRFFEGYDFIEIETPILQGLQGGANARPFVTHANALDQDMFLRIAPELYLKRALVAGFERIYEIGKNFRNEGIDTTHSPEFTMLEAYWTYANYKDMEMLVEMLVGRLMAMFNFEDVEEAFSRIDYLAAFDKVAEKFNYSGPRVAEMFKLEDHDRLVAIHTFAEAVDVEVGKDESFCKVVDLVFKKHVVKGDLFGERPFFVEHHPVEISPLAKRCKDNPQLTERFQLIWNRFEITNGFSELNDPEDQRRRFEEQHKDAEAMPLDEDFLTALKFGMPPAAGIGIGIDRLVMILTHQENIRDVVLFPTMRVKRSVANE